MSPVLDMRPRRAVLDDGFSHLRGGDYARDFNPRLVRALLDEIDDLIRDLAMLHCRPEIRSPVIREAGQFGTISRDRLCRHTVALHGLIGQGATPVDALDAWIATATHCLKPALARTA